MILKKHLKYLPGLRLSTETRVDTLPGMVAIGAFYESEGGT